MTEPLITTRQVAQALGVSEARVRRLVKKKRLTPNGKIGQIHTFRSDRHDEYMRTKRPVGRPRKVGNHAN